MEQYLTDDNDKLRLDIVAECGDEEEDSTFIKQGLIDCLEAFKLNEGGPVIAKERFMNQQRQVDLIVWRPSISTMATLPMVLGDMVLGDMVLPEWLPLT